MKEGSHPPSPVLNLISVNLLVTAALPLLLVFIRLKSVSMSDGDPAEMRHLLLSEINQFEMRARTLGFTSQIIFDARYCLCTALDEVIMTASWSMNNPWSQQTLLSIVHKETWGGERFFIILDKMLEEPRNSLPSLELMYMILSLGFEGKYYNAEKGIRDEIRYRLFHTIMLYRGSFNTVLSPSLNDLARPKVQVTSQKYKFKICVIAFLVWLIMAFIDNLLTYWRAAPVLQQLKYITQISL